MGQSGADGEIAPLLESKGGQCFRGAAPVGKFIAIQLFEFRVRFMLFRLPFFASTAGACSRLFVSGRCYFIFLYK